MAEVAPRVAPVALPARVAVAIAAICLAAAWFVTPGAAHADVIEAPPGERHAPFYATADEGTRFEQGAYEVWSLRGNCQLTQGARQAQARSAVLWIDRAAAQHTGVTKVIAYLEGDVDVRSRRGQGETAPMRLTDNTWLGRFYTVTNAGVRVRRLGDGSNQPPPRLANYEELVSGAPPSERGGGGIGERGGVRPAQFAPLVPPQATPGVQGAAGRRIRVFPRTSAGIQAETFPSPDGRERIAVIDSGVNILIEGVGEYGKLDISTDRVVLWTSAVNLPDLSGAAAQAADTPLELYLEGNIIFRQGDRVIYADRMYYNVAGKHGAVLQAELLTPVPDYQGLLRLKADVLQQLNETQFRAGGAAATSSRLGVPQYWFQSETIEFSDIQRPITDPFGAPVIDPATGDPAVDHDLLATSRNNFLYVLGAPVFYWPTIATDLTDPTFYLNSARFRSDGIFGTQVYLDWNAYQLLGIAPIRGTDWRFSTDYLSERGPAAGTDFEYERDAFLGFIGPTKGSVDVWGIKDNGRDDLGADRRSVPLEEEFRGRIRFRHAQDLAGGWRVKATADVINDHNFIEQYFEDQWDREIFPAAGIHLKRLDGNSSLGLLADVRTNDFFTQTGHYPRLEHFLLGQSLLSDWLSWHAHSFAEYADLQTADTAFPGVGSPLVWERPTDAAATVYDNREGLRAATRHEIDLPVQVGPVKVTSYVLGELAYWQEDRQGEELTRLLGQTGVRASLPMWRVDPNVQSRLLNLNGLAHKVTYEFEALYADADENFTDLPLYDPLNDDPLEAFERRFYLPSSGLSPTMLPPADFSFDPRYYAFRSGIQSYVAGPTTEIADDLTLARFAVRQRWQTKRGLPGQERIVDWITLDFGGNFYPDANDDNFGEDFGMFFYDFRWNVGDRVTVLSDGYADTFAQALKTASIGAVLTRPGQGQLYAGFRSIEGPISSNVVSASVTYRMSEKWIGSAAANMDLGPTGNVSESIRFIRIGESLLVGLTLSHDESRDNIGVGLSVQPRFLPGGSMADVAGIDVPPAGAFGLE